MPFNLSFTHIVVVAIVALIVLGPERLPAAARAAGAFYRQWREMSSGLQAEVRDVFSEFTEPFNDALSIVRTGDIPDDDDDDTPAAAPGTPVAVGDLSPLSPAIPALGPSTGLVSAGPQRHVEVPSLGPAPAPGTFVPMDGATPSP